MRVLYVIDGLSGGGAETSLADLVPHLGELGIEVHVAFFVAGGDVAERLRSGGAHLWPLIGAGGRLKRIIGVRALARKLRPDVIHTTLFEADIAGRVGARLARVPVVSSFVNEMYGPEQVGAGLSRWRLRLAWLADAATARLVSRFHAISGTVGAVMSNRLHVSGTLVEIIHRSRDPDLLGQNTLDRRLRVRAELELGADTPMILGVARHEYQKGLDTLIRASAIVLKDYPQLRVLIAGRKGNQTAQLTALIVELGLENLVKLMGRREDVADLLVAADVLAFPTRWEGLGGTLLEALALECPIVCSDLPVLHEAVGNDDFASFVGVDSPEELASAIITVLRTGRNVARLEAARGHFLRSYTPSVCAAAMSSFYHASLK